ncbi:MAG: hypothetical protein ACHQ7M_23770 [Chloroflexota bacterium]
MQGSGQYRLAQPEIEELHALDHQLAEAVDVGNGPRVHDLLGQMVSLARTRGTSVGPYELVASETILPPDTLTVEEVHALLHDDSLLQPSTPTAPAP